MINPESLIKAISDKALPPVEQWDPDYCGEIDLEIKADGSWYYASSPFTHNRMKLLFSRVIKKENEDYFLVTPVEKISIKVEWMPFVIIDYKLIKQDNCTIYQFKDNFENSVMLTQLSQLKLSQYQSEGQSDIQPLPDIKIPRNLFASFSRSCYYRLLNEASIVKSSDRNQVQITSNNIIFTLGEYQVD